MTKQQYIAILSRQRDAAALLTDKSTSHADFVEWRRNTEVAIERIFGDESRHARDFGKITYAPSAYFTGQAPSASTDAFKRGLTRANAVLNSMISEIEEFGLTDDLVAHEPDLLGLIEKLCRRFHYAAQRLRDRHADRPTLEITDEYDVQDLLHAILSLHFEDIRDEEWTPSYAGASSRVDFLLRAEQIVIEIKKTRKSLKQKELGEQLIIDRARYEAHPECKTLVCFVYDPDGLVRNPAGLKHDLEKHDGQLKVRVIIAP